ncbi:putative component of NuA3 histone acetyltransferase complex [Tilletia horrida]|uniref:uS12 prolyl 3,4-dihydroxylase n=1 Tax=Tilletia horrida TaxID=155126 RepID=A0AAN6GU47_9BASI|nr:putative component of NuA3 histone acetyltransferase complex [Tilletia horrida]KAK0556062.1 putative component of NuA3 histone acetyltransferase complex [Tilletia horrida]KAK0560591.1 putative component of NuA3 histone acetyltransferase complex [Tilletia horrida]
MSSESPSIKTAFSAGLLEEATSKDFAADYAKSQPYRHAVVPALIDDALLRAAREEIVEELRFAEKETDIYKVNQTGDLANLDGLPEEEAGRLKNLLRLRNALYSEEFRSWLMAVTGCGPLSAKKKDMSINNYTSGCHLLNHDDVISTRRVSYILYLPDPAQSWQPEWGGALELYPVVKEGEPANIPSKTIPPQWNQFTFFTVQPGHSFHSVEEVVHPTASRLSISGWFHRPQADEDSYDPADEAREEQLRIEHSSASALESKKRAKEERPFLPYGSEDDELQPPVPGVKLSQADQDFLSHFLNPAYLRAQTQAVLFERFGDDSHVLLSDFLKKELADALDAGLRRADADDGFQWWSSSSGASDFEAVKIRPHDAGVKKEAGWDLSGPPHRQRFVSLSSGASTSGGPLKSNPPASSIPSPLPLDDPTALLSLLRTLLLPSPAFRAFLANITQLVPLALRTVQARRFRPGLDYTLAESEAEGEVVLDVGLDLTPEIWNDARKAAGSSSVARKGPKGLGGGGSAKKAKAAANGASSADGRLKAPPKRIAKELERRWASGEVGGWECYMAPHEGEEDPAVYRSGGSASKSKENGGKAEEAMAVDDNEEEQGKGDENGEDDDEDMEDEDDEEEEDDDDDFDGVLLNLTPSFNSLSVVLRDEGVMRFVKYLGAAAGSSRWDVIGEWSVGQLEEDDEEDADADGN